MFQNITPITRNIIAINVVVYLISNFYQPDLLYYYLAAYNPLSPHFHWWQIISHMFMHAPFGQGVGLTHILFNMFTLLSFGPVLERTLGQKKFIWLYFLSGIGAYALNCGWDFVEIYRGTNINQIANTPMVGASGAIFGVVAGFATLFPDAKLMFFFIPFPIKAKILLPIIIIASIFLGWNGNVGGIAHFAHVGGAIVGYLIARHWKQNRYRIY